MTEKETKIYEDALREKPNTCVDSIVNENIECSEFGGVRHEYEITLNPNGKYKFCIDGIEQNDLKQPFVFKLK